MKKMLIINPFGIGDVIFSTPLIETLRSHYPDSYICYICNRRAYEVLKFNPHLNSILVYEKDEYRATWKRSKVECIKKIAEFLKSIYREKFDMAIDLSLGYQYSLLLKFTGIKRRLGFNYRDRGRFLTDKIDIGGFNEKHVIEYYLDILKLIDIEPNKRDMITRVFVGPEEDVWVDKFLKSNGINSEDRLVGVVPGCGASWGADAEYRRWDRANFAKVCDGIIELYGMKVILFGDSKEVEICEDIQKQMAHKAIMASGATSLGNFLGLVKRCTLLITNDGGPLHMAVGLGVNTISIFGPVDEMIYGPYPPSPAHVTVTGRAKCRPCYKNFKFVRCPETSCLKEISTERVLAAVAKIMKKPG